MAGSRRRVVIIPQSLYTTVSLCTQPKRHNKTLSIYDNMHVHTSLFLTKLHASRTDRTRPSPGLTSPHKYSGVSSTKLDSSLLRRAAQKLCKVSAKLDSRHRAARRLCKVSSSRGHRLSDCTHTKQLHPAAYVIQYRQTDALAAFSSTASSAADGGFRSGAGALSSRPAFPGITCFTAGVDRAVQAMVFEVLDSSLGSSH